MKFHYIAINASGRTIEGNYEADNSLDVLKYLTSQGLKPLSLKILKEVEGGVVFRIFKKSVSLSDKIFLTKYLSLMLKIGTDLFKAIDILIADFDNQSLKALLIEIRLGLEKGQPFYNVFAKHPNIFSPVFVNLIKAGEASGNLENVLEQLSISLQRDQDLKNKIKAAITYPIILAIVSIFVLIFLISFALPKIANVFNSGGFEPPAFSKFVFSISLFAGDYVWFIVGLFILIIFAGWFFAAKTLAGKKIFYRFITKLPAVGEVLKKTALQRFVSTLSALLLAGMPILNSLEITADAVGSEEIKSALFRISREGISKGMTIGEAFRREPVFPRMVVNLMAISEKAGHIESMLSTMGDFYESEIESSIKGLVSFLEPVLLMVIGLVIAFIALSIIVPIYQLVGQF